jgi:hypothetical protein
MMSSESNNEEMSTGLDYLTQFDRMHYMKELRGKG